VATPPTGAARGPTPGDPNPLTPKRNPTSLEVGSWAFDPSDMVV
jgi:hypothetical protein